jgi:alpha-glucoside transport system substrate-binding protein
MLVTACGPSPSAKGGAVQFLGAWEGAELDAFESVVAPFEARTGVDVVYSSTRDLRGSLDDAFRWGTPPDVAGLEGPAHMRELAQAGRLKDLTRAIDIQRYKSDVAPTFIELGTVGSNLVGAFAKSTLKGIIWYDPSVFRQGVPDSFDELKAMSRTMVASDTRSWCVGLESQEATGWPGTDWIEAFILHDGGLGIYDAWVAGQLPWTSDEVRAAFQAFGQIVAPDVVFGGAEGAVATSFSVAGEPLFQSPPGCLLMLQGSFMPAFFEAAGHRPVVDFDFMPFPERGHPATDKVLGAGDLLGLLTDDRNAADLIDYLVGAEAQQSWVSRGGALSVNRRVTEYPDAVAAREAMLLSSAAHFRFDGSDLMPARMNTAFWHGVIDFTLDQSRLDQILASLDDVRAASYGD